MHTYRSPYCVVNVSHGVTAASQRRQADWSRYLPVVQSQLTQRTQTLRMGVASKHPKPLSPSGCVLHLLFSKKVAGTASSWKDNWSASVLRCCPSARPVSRHRDVANNELVLAQIYSMYSCLSQARQPTPQDRRPQTKKSRTVSASSRESPHPALFSP